MAIYNDILTLNKVNEFAGLNLWPTTFPADPSLSLPITYLSVAAGGGGGGSVWGGGGGGGGYLANTTTLVVGTTYSI
jgi:hypothetical protein